MLIPLLERLGNDLKLEQRPFLDEQKKAYLKVPKNIHLEMNQLENSVRLTAEIAHCPKNKREALFSKIMSANLLGSGTGGAVLSLDSEEGALYLNRHFSDDVTYDELYNAIEDLVNYVDYWREELKTHEKGGV